MSTHKNHQHLEKIKDAIAKAHTLSEEEKSASLKRVEEWAREDKATGIIYEELLEISSKIKPILSEIGLI
jgi:hypothetical protein